MIHHYISFACRGHIDDLECCICCLYFSQSSGTCEEEGHTNKHHDVTRSSYQLIPDPLQTVRRCRNALSETSLEPVVVGKHFKHLHITKMITQFGIFNLQVRFHKSRLSMK